MIDLRGFFDASPADALDFSALVEPCDAREGAAIVQEWLEQVGGDWSEHVMLTEKLRLARIPRSGPGMGDAVLWLHLIEGPAVMRLCADVADRLRVVERGQFSRPVKEYLRDRGERMLANAVPILRTSADYFQFLDGAPLAFDGSQFLFNENQKLARELVLDAVVDRPMGVARLRGQLISGRDLLDKHLLTASPAIVCNLRGALEAYLTNSQAVYSLTAYVETFPVLNEDGEWLRTIVDELERRDRIGPGHADHRIEAQLLAAARSSASWNGELARRFCQLQALAVRHEQIFQSIGLEALTSAYVSDPARASNAALVLMLWSRLRVMGNSSPSNVAMHESLKQSLLNLPDGPALHFVGERLREISFEIRGDKAAWNYLSQQEKNHWAWLVYSHVVERRSLCEAFVRFVMEYLPRDPFSDVEPLIVELADDAALWEVLSSIANETGGVAMIRAGSLLRRRKLGRASKLTTAVG